MKGDSYWRENIALITCQPAKEGPINLPQPCAYPAAHLNARSSLSMQSLEVS